MICLQCGECCTSFIISSIGKPAGVRCWNLDENNRCKIYKTRPEECRKHDYPAAVCPIGAKKRGMPKYRCANCGAGVYEESMFCCTECSDEYVKPIKKPMLL